MTRSALEAFPAYSSMAAAGPIERVLLPRLLPVIVAAPTTSAPAADPARRGAPIEAVDRERFLRAVLGTDDAATDQAAHALLSRGVTAQSIYLDLLAPTARALGDLWSDDACDFMEVTIALGRLQGVVRSLSRVFIAGGDETSRPAGRALIACIPGEQHTLGMFIVAEFLIRDGWGVSVGPPVIESDLLEMMRTEWFDVVGFSVTCESRLGHLRREIRRVRAASRNRHLGVLVGGRVFNERPELIDRVGADGSSMDASQVPDAARRLMQSRVAGDGRPQD